jgi:hypothetical protein
LIGNELVLPNPGRAYCGHVVIGSGFAAVKTMTLISQTATDDTSTANTAVGHANGTATVIKGFGKAASTFTDPVYFGYVLRLGDAPMLFVE